MSIFNKLKKSAVDALDSDRIGEIQGERNDNSMMNSVEGRPMKKQKKSSGGFGKLFGGKDKKKKNKKRNSRKENYNMDDNQLVQQVAMNSESASEEEDVAKYIKTKNVGGRTRSILLSQLEIKEQISVPSYLVTPEQIETVEFTPTIPSGLSVDEVNEFCDSIEVALRDYQGELLRLITDKEKLIDEIIRIERQILEDRNQNMLDSFMADGSSEREKMRESLISTQLANKELAEENEKLKVTQGNDPKVAEENRKLKSMVERMKAQVEASATENGTEELTAKLMAVQAENAKLSQMVERLRGSAGKPQPSARGRQPMARPTQQQRAPLVTPTVPTIDPLSPDDDYERKVMEQFNKKHGATRRVRRPMTTDDIKKMQASQGGQEVVIPGFDDDNKKSRPPASSGETDSEFNSMLNDFEV